jgi:hypothetical protein
MRLLALFGLTETALKILALLETEVPGSRPDVDHFTKAVTDFRTPHVLLTNFVEFSHAKDVKTLELRV